jgi:hypothetical protein
LYASSPRLTAEGKLGEAGQKLEQLKRKLDELNARQKLMFFCRAAFDRLPARLGHTAEPTILDRAIFEAPRPFDRVVAFSPPEEQLGAEYVERLNPDWSEEELRRASQLSLFEQSERASAFARVY